MEECEKKWTPLMQAQADGLLAQCPGVEYIALKHRLGINYPLCVMCYVYIILEKGHDAVKTHPVMDRLTRYRFLFKELEPLDNMMKEQTDVLLDRLKKGLPLNLVHPVKEMQTPTSVPLLNATKSTGQPSAGQQQQEQASQPEEESSSSEDDESNAVVTAAAEVLADDAKRQIGQAIAKNRGLTPYRRKDLKNPRVKYKTKYQAKVKRRKGQVRPVRDQIPYYSGEKTGINAYAVKSIKLK
ncbi:Sas10 C-terminal domain [Trinorchestia longiramus]|nr:Sas10 C-terminal domain [Trinorchestia longiramus]